jgi:hypothetical protein
LQILNPEALERATRGASLRFKDDLEQWHEENQDTEPVVIWYGVRTVCCGGKSSEFSNFARLEPQLPPEPPQGLTAQATGAGIVLSWQSVAELKVLVERSPDGVNWSTITPESLDAGEWTDLSAEQGRSWSYRLRGLRTLPDGGQVVGNPGEVARVDHPDVYPPSAPQDLVCLPEGQHLRLRWQGVADAASYRIYRQAGSGNWDHIGDVRRERVFLDTAPPLGALTYGVRAVDAAGNESEPATCSSIMGSGT